MARAEAKAGADYTIEVEGLTKSFSGKVVVRDLSLRVRRGEIYGFLGPNGSGKTTTLRMLCGLLRPDRGRGTALGFDITRQNAAIKRLVGYMTQRFSLYEDLSIRENLDFVARVYGVEKPAEAVRQASVHAFFRSRNFSCSTSRPPVSIQRRAVNSGARSMPLPPVA